MTPALDFPAGSKTFGISLGTAVCLAGGVPIHASPYAKGLYRRTLAPWLDPHLSAWVAEAAEKKGGKPDEAV